jgi:hypothetical protein
MKRSIAALTLALFFVSLLAFGMAFKARKGNTSTSLVPSAQASNRDDDEDGDENEGRCPRDCSERSLKGCFGTTITGTLVGGPLAGPVAGIALQRFDGEGGFTQVDTVSINGTLVTPPTGRSATGTYTVNPDCTGSATINFTDQPPLHLNFVLDDHGRELRAVVTDRGLTTTSIGRKQ